MLFQTENTKPTEGGENTAGFSGWLYDWAEALVTALVVIVLLFSFVMRVSTVDGDSMLPTLHDGEFLLVSDLFYSPDPGDIIVAKSEALCNTSEMHFFRRNSAISFANLGSYGMINLSFAGGEACADHSETDRCAYSLCAASGTGGTDCLHG